MMSSEHGLPSSLTLSSLCEVHYWPEPSYQVRIFWEFQASATLAQQFHLRENVIPSNWQ